MCKSFDYQVSVIVSIRHVRVQVVRLSGKCHSVHKTRRVQVVRLSNKCHSVHKTRSRASRSTIRLVS